MASREVLGQWSDLGGNALTPPRYNVVYTNMALTARNSGEMQASHTPSREAR